MSDEHLVENRRWSDDRMAQFYREFKEHLAPEREAAEQQKEIYDAIFRKEDADKNIGPGVIQLLAQVNARTVSMEIANDRQKRFVGGIVFAIGALGFFLTDSAHKLMSVLRGL